MESYLKNNVSKNSKNTIDEAKENKDKSPSSTKITHLSKNSSENFANLAREKLFDPKEYILKERLNEFNKKNQNRIQNSNADNNLLNKSINEKKSASGNFNAITYQDSSLNTRNNPTPNFSDFKTIDYLDKIYNNKNKNSIQSKDQTNEEEEDITNFINEAHECIKNHITKNKSPINANASDKNSSNNFSKSNFSKNNLNENYFIPNTLNRNINNIITKNEDSFLIKMQKDKISKKHRDIDNTLEEIKNNLNNLSNKIKSNDVKNISKHSSKIKLITKKSGIESSESDGEIEYISKKYKENEFYLKNKNISSKKLGDKNKYISNNTSRSYSSGDSVNAEDFSKSLFDNKLRNEKEHYSKNLNPSKSRFNDPKNLNAALSSYNTKHNPAEHYKNNSKFSVNLKNANIASSNFLANKNLEDSIGYKIKSNSKNKPESSNWSSEKKYYSRKKFISGNMLLNCNKDEETNSTNLVNNLNNSISLMKEKNNKYKNYNEYITYEEYQATQENADKNESKLFNKSKFKHEELKEKNDFIEKELDVIQKNFKEIRTMSKDKKVHKQDDLQLNEKNLNLMFQSIQPVELAKIKRKNNNNPFAEKSHDFSVSDSNNKNKNNKNYVSESDDEISRNYIDNYLNKNEVFSENAAATEPEISYKKADNNLKNIANIRADVLFSREDEEKNNRNPVKNKSKEKENNKFYYVKKNIKNVSNSRNKSKEYENLKSESIANAYYMNSANLYNRNKDFLKGGKIVSTKLNRTEKHSSNNNYNNSLNFSKLNKSQEKFENVNARKASNIKSSPNPNRIQASYSTNVNENNNNINYFKHEFEKSTKQFSLLEKKIENYEEKITSYKNLLNQYMPEDISPELFTIINSYLNGKDRWFLLKKNLLKDQVNNLFWVREAELMNLGFNINFNLFKNDNFDFCLIANNLHKLREDSKRFIGEIKDLKNFLNQELEKKEIILDDKNNEIKKIHDKNLILNDYIKKLEAEKQNNDLALLNTTEKYNNESLLEENKQLNLMIKDFKINIKNLLEDNLRFKAENEKLEAELKTLNANLNSEKSLKKSSSLGKIPVQNKTKVTNIKNNNSFKKTFSSNRMKTENRDSSVDYPLDAEELNNSASKASFELKNKLKSSIIENLITESEFYNNKKEFEDLQSQNDKLELQLNSLKTLLEQTKSDLSNKSQKLIETEKASEALIREKEKLINYLEAEKEKNKNISGEKEYMETQIKKIPDLINEEITKFKKQKESNEKKHKQALENLQKEKQELEAKLTEVVNLYNEVVDVNKKHESYICELEEIVNKFEEEHLNNEGKGVKKANYDLVKEIENIKQMKSEMEDHFHKEIHDLKEILRIKEENNYILNKNKEILEKEIDDLKAQNNNLTRNLDALRKVISVMKFEKEEENMKLKDLANSAVSKENLDSAVIIKKVDEPILDNIKIKEDSKQFNQIEINNKKNELNIKSANNNLNKNDDDDDENKEDPEYKRNLNNEDNNKPKKAPKYYDIPLQAIARSGSTNRSNLNNNNISLNSSNLNNVSENQISIFESNNNALQLQNTITNLNAVIEDLNKKLLNYEKAITEKDSCIADSNHNYLEIKEHYEKNYLSPSQIDEILAEINSKHEENLEEIKDYYEKQLKNYNNYVKELEHQKEAEANNANDISSKSQKEISDKNLKIKDLEDKLKKLLIMEETSSTSKKQIKDLENANKDLKERLCNKENELLNSINFNKETNEIKKRLEIELHSEQDKFDKYIRDADDEKAQVFEKEIKELKDKLLESEMKAESLEAEVKKKDKLLNEFELEKNNDSNFIKKLQEQIKINEEEKLRNGESLNKIMLDLENEKQDLQSKLEKAEKIIAERSNEIIALKNNLKNQENELEKKHEALESFEFTNEKNLEEIKDYKALLTENEKNLLKIKNDSNELNTKIEAFEQSLKLSNQKYEKLFEENENNKNTIEEQKEIEKQLIEKVTELEKVEEKLKNNNFSLEKTIQHMKNSLSDKDDLLLNENKNLNEINDKLKNQIEILEKSIEEASIDLKNNAKTISEFKEAIERLKHNCDKSETEYIQIIDALQNELKENKIKLEESNYLRSLLNEKTEKIELLIFNLKRLEDECSKEKDALITSLSNLESEKKSLINRIEVSEKIHSIALEDHKKQLEETLLKKDDENKDKIQKILKDKETEMQLKEECFVKAQENSLRELNSKQAQLTQRLSESENAFEECKNKKSLKSKKLKAEINQLTLHNESLIQKLMEKDNYINEILSELESAKESNSIKYTDRENQIMNFSGKIEDLEKANINKETEINLIKNDFQKASQEIKNYKQKVSESNENLYNLTNQSAKEKNKYELVIKSLDEIIGNKIKEIELVNNEKEEIKKEMHNVRLALKEKENKILEMQSDIKSIAIKINENKENYLNEMQKLNEDKANLAEKYKKEIEELENKITESEKNIKNLHKKTKNNISDNAKTNKNHPANVAENLSINKKDSQNKLSENNRYSENEDAISVNDDFKDLELSLTSEDREKERKFFNNEDLVNIEIKNENKNFEHEIDMKNLEIEQLKATIYKDLEEINKLKEKLSKIESDVLESEIEKQDNEIKFENFAEEIKGLKALNLELKTNEINLKDELNIFKEDSHAIIDRLTIANEKYLNRINELTEEIGKLNDMNMRTSQASYDVQNSISVNNEDIEIELLKDELKHKDRKLMDIKEEMFKLKFQIEESLSEINSKEKEIILIKTQNKDLNQKISNLNELLNEAKKEIQSKEDLIKNHESKNQNEQTNLVISSTDNLEIVFTQEKDKNNVLLFSKNTENSNFPNKNEEDIENYEEEIANYKIQIESLKELIYEKGTEAVKILEENEKNKNELENLKNSLMNNNNKNNDQQFEQTIINNNINSTFMSKLTEDIKDDSNGLIAKEKLMKIKSSLDNYKADNNNLLQQMNLLKNEMKIAREKYEKSVSYDGKIANFDEFSDLIGKIFEGYKPK